jgi:hypothetical protein
MSDAQIVLAFVLEGQTSTLQDRYTVDAIATYSPAVWSPSSRH